MTSQDLSSQEDIKLMKNVSDHERRSTLPMNFMSTAHKFSDATSIVSTTSSQEGENKLFPNASAESRALSYGVFNDMPLRATSEPDIHLSEFVFERGLSTNVAAAFLAVSVASNGALEMPKALSNFGWFGVFFFILMFWNSMYANLCLGQCWILLEQRWPEYKTACMNPYPTIADRAVGPWMKYTVSFLMDIMLIFVGISHLLISSKIMGHILENDKYCYWIILLPFVWMPISWFRSPRKFGFLAVADVVFTELSIILMMVNIAMIRKDTDYVAKFPSLTVDDFIMGVGSTAFFFGGASIFPTVLTDMKQRKTYFNAVLGGYLGVFVMYLPLAYISFEAFGQDVGTNIFHTIDTHTVIPRLTLLHGVLYVIHLSISCVIVLNPVFQDIEKYFKCNRKFGYQRCLTRAGIMLVILLISMSLPSLSLVLKVIVGLSASCLSFIFPPIFYVMLLLQERRIKPNTRIGRKNLLILAEITLSGIFLSAAGTYVPAEIAKANFPISCYKNLSTTSPWSMLNPGIVKNSTTKAY